MESYFYKRDGAVIGPLAQRDLLALRAQGRLEERSWVRQGVDGCWRTLGELFPDRVPGVVEVLQQQGDQLKFACPFCSQRYLGMTADYAGTELTCASCGSRITVPAAAALEKLAAARLAEPLPQEIPPGSLCCPHCWKSFPPEYLLSISRHPELVGDPLLGDNEPQRFLPQHFDAEGRPLDAKGECCSDTACPHCHLRIPVTLEDFPSRFFSIVGSPASGKSYYLATLVNRLKRRMGRAFGWSFSDADPGLNATLNSYEQMLFMPAAPGKVVQLPKTQQTGEGFSDRVLLNGALVNLPKPMIFALTECGGNLSGGGRTGSNLIFYDNAGEHFQPGADDAANPATLHLSRSDGILFLFDPTRDAQFRPLCDQAEPQLAETTKLTDQVLLFAEMVNRLRKHRPAAAEWYSSVPLVIVLAKCDALRPGILPVLPDLEELLTTGSNGVDRALARERICELSLATRERFEELHPDLTDLAESCFSTVWYLPASSFGCLASRDEVTGGIGVIPERIRSILPELPMLVELAEQGLIEWDRRRDPAVPVLPGCRFLRDGIAAADPEASGRFRRLPLSCAGEIVTFHGKRWRLPDAPDPVKEAEPCGN